MESTFSAIEEAALIAAAIPENRVALGAVALLAYEYIITLGREVRFIWMHKKTGAMWLFLVVRYHALLSMVLLESISYSYYPIPDHVCSMYVKAQTALQVAQYIVWAAFSGLRALALSGMNWTLASMVFLLACAPFAVNLWVISGIGTFAYNLPLAGALLTINAVHLTLSMLSINGLADQISEVAVFIDPLTAILICRFLLALHSTNLRLTGEEHATDDSAMHTRTRGTPSTLKFASFVTSMGGAVDIEERTTGEEGSPLSRESERDDRPHSVEMHVGRGD
ncbi:hypothetical protein ACG7TL_008994 [Trametes sanguinea]